MTRLEVPLVDFLYILAGRGIYGVKVGLLQSQEVQFLMGPSFTRLERDKLR
jgi:hypothetical protein